MLADGRQFFAMTGIGLGGYLVAVDLAGWTIRK